MKMIKKKDADFRSFIAFDFETTGLSSDAKIIEIGAVKVQDGYLVSRYSSLVDPEVVIDPFITSITGISNEMVRGKPTIAELLPSFREFCGNLPMVAHNASFDCRFLTRESEANGFYFDNELFDTLSFARKILSKQPSYKLGALTALLGIPLNDAHRAWCDAEACARLYMVLKAKADSLKY